MQPTGDEELRQTDVLAELGKSPPTGEFEERIGENGVEEMNRW
jgi:hypothetical protein